MIKNIDTGNAFTWTVVEFGDAPDTEEELKKYNISSEIVAYALDKKERARMEYRPKVGSFVLIFNAIKLDKNENHYETIPVTFVMNDNRLVSIVDTESNYIIEMMEEQLKNEQQMSPFKFLFSALKMITERYFPVIEEIDAEKNEINSRLRKNTTKKNLFALSDIETGILYLLSAANQNSLLMEQIKSNEIYDTFSHEEKEQLEDAMVEAKQLYSMNFLLSQIMEQLSATYNNILNNNLNANLTNLNILAILLAVFSAITGFYGMNVRLPLMKYEFAWVYIVVGASLLMLVMLKILRNLFPKDKS